MHDLGKTATASPRLMESKYSVVKEKGFKRINIQYLEKGPPSQGQREKFHTMATKTYNSSECTQKGCKTSSERTYPVCG